MSNKSKGIRYDEEFKKGAVRLVTERGRPVAGAAADLGLTPQTLYRWINGERRHQDANQARIDELEAALKAEKRRVADLEETVAILKKATAIFAMPRK